jgi:hypothetical protein
MLARQLRTPFYTNFSPRSVEIEVTKECMFQRATTVRRAKHSVLLVSWAANKAKQFSAQTNLKRLPKHVPLPAYQQLLL